MLKRLIDSVIDNHYASTKKALLLTGARQIGKTYAPRDYSLLGPISSLPLIGTPVTTPFISVLSVIPIKDILRFTKLYGTCAVTDDFASAIRKKRVEVTKNSSFIAKSLQMSIKYSIFAAEFR